MIKAVIFDYDETLVQTLASRIKAYQTLARNEYHFELSEEQVRVAFGKPYTEFIKQLFGDVDSVESIISKYQALSANFPIMAYEGSVETVNILVDKYLVGMVTGVRRNVLMADLAKLNFPLDKLFFIQCGEDTIAQKPDPAVFQPLLIELEKRKIQPDETVYVGDDLRDFQAATGAGFSFIGMAKHTTLESTFTEAGAAWVIKFEELEKMIRI